MRYDDHETTAASNRLCDDLPLAVISSTSPPYHPCRDTDTD